MNLIPRLRVVAAPLLTTTLLFASFNVFAQQADPAKLIEEARARAKKIDEIKAVLNDPDQTVRLAAFEAMVGSGDPLMRDLAIQAGFAASDSTMRALAFKHALLGLDRLVFALAVDEGEPKERIEHSKAVLERTGSTASIGFDRKRTDVARGNFYRPGFDYSGKVEGLAVTFNFGEISGELRLQDDNTLLGRVIFHEGVFKAKASPF